MLSTPGWCNASPGTQHPVHPAVVTDGNYCLWWWCISFCWGGCLVPKGRTKGRSKAAPGIAVHAHSASATFSVCCWTLLLSLLPPSSMSSFLSTMTSKIPLSLQLCPRLFPSCSRNTIIGLFYFLQGQSSLSTSSQPNPAPDPTHEPPVLMGLLCGYRPPKAALSLSSQAGSCAAG